MATLYIILYYIEGAKGGFCITKKSPEIEDVHNLLRHHSADWNDLGIELGISENACKELGQNVALNANVKLNKILHLWIQGQPTPVTWEKVFEVVRKLNFTDTAKEIKRFLGEVDTVDKYKGKPNFEPFEPFNL